MGRRAQASFEFMLTVAIIMLVLTPILYYFISYEAKVKEDVSKAQISDFYNVLMNYAIEIYYSGPYGKKSFYYKIPPGITRISSPDEHTIVFTLVSGGKNTTLAYYSRVPIKIKGFEKKEYFKNQIVAIKKTGINYTVICPKGRC